MGGDSDYGFFPTVPDETFGYGLQPVDLAMTEVMAAEGRNPATACSKFFGVIGSGP
jgi:hypothetical protein